MKEQTIRIMTALETERDVDTVLKSSLDFEASFAGFQHKADSASS
jgi:hypothetical protein